MPRSSDVNSIPSVSATVHQPSMRPPSYEEAMKRRSSRGTAATSTTTITPFTIFLDLPTVTETVDSSGHSVVIIEEPAESRLCSRPCRLFFLLLAVAHLIVVLIILLSYKDWN